jgi:hypothetical protein
VRTTRTHLTQSVLPLQRAEHKECKTAKGKMRIYLNILQPNNNTGFFALKLLVCIYNYNIPNPKAKPKPKKQPKTQSASEVVQRLLQQQHKTKESGKFCSKIKKVMGAFSFAPLRNVALQFY